MERIQTTTFWFLTTHRGLRGERKAVCSAWGRWIIIFPNEPSLKQHHQLPAEDALPAAQGGFLAGMGDGLKQEEVGTTVSGCGEEASCVSFSWCWHFLNYHTTQQSHSWTYTQRKPLIQKDTCTLMFTAALSAIARSWKQPKCPSTEEWIKKMLLSHKKERNCLICRHGWT